MCVSHIIIMARFISSNFLLYPLCVACLAEATSPLYMFIEQLVSDQTVRQVARVSFAEGSNRSHASTFIRHEKMTINHTKTNICHTIAYRQSV